MSLFLLNTFSQGLRECDSISKFFNEEEINFLEKLDKEFIFFVIQEKKDTNRAFDKYISTVLKEFSKQGDYAKGTKGLVEFYKLNLLTELKESSAYEKIFWDSEVKFGIGDDQIISMCSGLQTNGGFVSFLEYYKSINELRFWSEYINAIQEMGTYTHFIDTLGAYKEYLDFNNQVHRLVLMMHIINHTSIYGVFYE